MGTSVVGGPPSRCPTALMQRADQAGVVAPGFNQDTRS